MVTPREIAAAAWFLLSDDASAVTGHVLHVDAGQGVSGSSLLSIAEQALDVRAVDLSMRAPRPTRPSSCAAVGLWSVSSAGTGSRLPSLPSCREAPAPQ
jgi:Enoyl-(Acyl carrier protein) reductase